MRSSCEKRFACCFGEDLLQDDTNSSLCSVSELRVFLSESWKDHANFTDIHDMGSAVQDLESIIHRATNNYSKDFPVH